MEVEYDILQSNLNSIAELLKDDWDWLVCLNGDERVGKSTLAVQMGVCIDPHFSIRNCVYDWNKLRRTALDLPKRSAIFYSEARILSRRRLSHFNVAMVEALSIIGYRNQFFMFNFPDFWELDPYLKNHRCRTRVDVKSYMGHRGIAHFYARVKKPFPDRRGRSVWWKYAFTYHFKRISRQDGWDDEMVRLWEEYVRRDQREKERLLSDDPSDYRVGITMRMRQRGHTFKDISAALGMTDRNLYRLVKGWRKEGFRVP